MFFCRLAEWRLHGKGPAKHIHTMGSQKSQNNVKNDVSNRMHHKERIPEYSSPKAPTEKLLRATIGISESVAKPNPRTMVLQKTCPTKGSKESQRIQAWVFLAWFSHRTGTWDLQVSVTDLEIQYACSMFYVLIAALVSHYVLDWL